jgi:hypothetical protein
MLKNGVQASIPHLLQINIEGACMFRYFRDGGALVCFLFFLSGCGNNPSPTISGFSPVGATAGTTITITGTNFDVGPVNNVVTFSGIAAVVTSSTPTQIVTTVPAGATSGPISITVDEVSHATSATIFTVLALPTFTPASASVGTTVTITGTNFDPTAANNSVTFNGTAAVVTSSTPTQIVTTVPADATSGPIAITVDNGNYSLTSSTSFIVTP